MNGKVFSRVHATLQVTLSVCRSVGLSHFAFFAFLDYLQVGKHIFEYLVNFINICISISHRVGQ